MSVILSYLSRMWRRKSAVLGVLTVVLIFLTATYKSSDRRGLLEPESVYAERLVGIHKHLQQTEEKFEAVKFIPGVPGSSYKKKPKVPPNHSGYEDQSGGRRNHQVGQESRVVKPLTKKEQVQKNHQEAQAVFLDNRQQARQKIQPAEDGNVEYRENGGMDPNLHAPQHNSAVFYFNQEEVNNRGSLDMGESGQGQGLSGQGQGQLGQGQGLSGQGQGQSGMGSGPGTEPAPIYIPPQRLVHLDLKGAPPSVAYLKKVLRTSHEVGATGVLMEWEDMFPWSGQLAGTAAKNHYSREEVKDLLGFCSSLGLEVIPLVQTFGHLEFVLKHQEFSHLRDVAEMPESVCPCHNDTMALIRMIIDQVMVEHKGARYINIGCDEVYHLGECQECMDSGRTSVFVDHVTRVAEYVRNTYQITPIIWDDMLRNMMQEEMEPLAGLVEPMVWVYAEDVYRFVPPYTWDRYSKVFDWIWTASAFKGAHGETLVVPPIPKHLNNNLNWLALMGEQQAKLKGGFRGIVVTGWQRYDHFAVLCELLPAGLPSLVLSLLVVSRGVYNNSLGKPLYAALGCSEQSGKYSTFLDLDSDMFMWDKLSWCFFPGNKFFKVTKELVMLETEVAEYLNKVEKKKGWLTSYNIRHNMSSPFRIDEGLEDWSRYQHEVVSLMRNAKEALSEMFDHYTVGEWVEQKVYPLYSRLSHLRSEADGLRQVRNWPSRPYEPIEALKGLGIGVPPTSPPPSPAPVQEEESGERRPKRRVQAPDYYSSRRKSS